MTGDQPRALTAVGKLRLGDHCCLGFRTDEQREEILINFVADGLAAGQKVLYLTDSTTPDAVREWLARRGLAVEPFIGSGQLVLATAGELVLDEDRFDPDTSIAALRREAAAALSSGYTGLRLTGEMGWALSGVPGTDRLLEFEAKLHRLLRTRTIVGICQYDLRRFTSEELVDIEGQHSTSVGPNPVYADGLLRIARTGCPPGLRFAGDVDVSNVGAVHDALALVVADGGDVHLDLSGLDFCDVGGIRAMVATAQGMGPERRVVVHGLAPHLVNVIRVVGWDELPNLVFEPGVPW